MRVPKSGLRLLPMLLCLQAGSSWGAIRIEAASLTRCLEQLSQQTGARFVVSDELSQQVRSCRGVEDARDVAQALRVIFEGSPVRWRLQEDGVFMLVSQAVPPRVRMAPLLVEADEAADDLPQDGPEAPLPWVAQWQSQARYGARELAVKPLLQFNQISRLAPNVYSNGESLSIRGVPRDNNYFTGNAVFYDGIEISTLLLDNNLLAIDELESLRYGRGSSVFLHGSGAAGGAIYLDTPQPEPELSGRAWLSAGQRDAYGSGASITGPICDWGLSGRIAVSRSEDPRFVQNRARTVEGITGTTDTRRRANAKLRFEPEALPGLTMGATLFYVGGDNPDRFVARRPRGASDEIFDEVSYDETAVDWGISAVGKGLTARYQADSGLDVAFAASDTRVGLQSWIETGPVRDDHFAGENERHRRYALTANVPLAGAWGAYLGWEAQQITSDEWTLRHIVPLPPSPGEAFDRRAAGVRELDNDSLFAELHYVPHERWKLALGARALQEEQHFFLSQHDSFAVRPPVLSVPLESLTRYSKLLPAGGVAFQATPNHGFSLKYDQAYRSGGYSPLLGGDYFPERLQTLELAWHGSWLAERLQAQFNLFRSDWDRRTSIDGTVGTYVLIPPESRTHGAELELEFDWNEQLTLRTGIGWLDSAYTQGRFGANPRDFTGRRTADAPRWTFTGGAAWQSEHGWYAGLDAYRASSAVSAVLGPQYNGETVPTRTGYTVVDARIGWRNAQWDCALTANNLFDARYIDHYDRLKPFSRLIGEPRQMSVRASWSW